MLGLGLGVDVEAGVTLMLRDGDTEFVGEGLELGTNDFEGETDIDGVLEVEILAICTNGDTLGEGFELGTNEVEGEIDKEGVLESDAAGLTD